MYQTVKKISFRFILFIIMKKFYITLFCLSCVALGFSQTIATIDRLNGSGPTATDQVANMTAVGLTRGSGINQAGTVGAATFASRDFTIGGTLADAQANNEYIEWSISANTAFEIALDDLDIRLIRNANGPTNWQLYYSLDGFTTPGSEVAITGPQTVSTTATDFNALSLSTGVFPINSGVSGTITFRLYAWDALANNGNIRVAGRAAWSISPAVAQPGIRLIGSVSTSSTNSVESDIVASTFPLFPVQQNIAYAPTYTTPSGLNLGNAVPLGAFTIRDGGASAADSDTDGTTLTELTVAVANHENIAALALLDLGTFSIVSEVTTVTSSTSFSGLNLVAADNGTRQFIVLASFNTTVTDNEQIQLTITEALTPVTGSSLFSAANAGAAQTSVAGDDNRIEVTANQFQFNQQPTNGNQLEVMVPNPTLIAVDANLNQDLDATITGINITTSPSSSIVSETYDMTNGEVILDAVVFTDSETGISLVANAPGLSGTSDPFDINGPLVPLAQQNFDTATGWAYTSDTPFFGTVADWGDTLGYFGEIALADAAPLDSPLFSGTIFGENDLNDTANPFAILTFADVDVSTFSNVSIEFDWQVVGYVNNANDIQYRLVINGSTTGTGGWQTVFDGNGPISDAQGRVKIPIADGNTTVGIQIRLRNNLATGYSGFDNFRVVTEFNGLIYTNAGGWKNNTPPDATSGALDALVIDGTYAVSNNAQINNLIINSGAATSIDFGKSLIVNGSLINDGDLELISISNNYSSLIVNGSIKNDITYKRHVNQIADTGTTSGNNDLISAPVGGLNFADLRAANPDLPSGTIGGVPSFLFGPFDNDTNAYINYTTANDSDALESGVGYRTASTQVGGSNFSFTGNVVIEQSPVPISVGTASVFNLVGNPYPSYISLSGFLLANNSEFDPLRSGVYGYDGDATDGFTIWNQAFSDFNPGKLIAPGQGFLVASKAGGGVISFPTVSATLPQTDIRSIGTSDDFILGRSSTDNLAHLKLQLSKGNDVFNTDFYFNDNASLGMDPGYDSAIFGSTPSNFALYSHLVENNQGVDMAIQSVGFTDLNSVIFPLGIHITEGEQVTVSLLESTIPDDTTVILEDNVNNTFTNLLTNDYTFTPSVSITDTGRFYVHVERSSLGTTENLLNGLEVFAMAQPKQIVVKGQLENKTTLKVFDIQGRLVHTSLLNKTETTHRIDVSNLTGGIYVVQLNNTSGNRTQKVILN
jgi:lipopolysaccharide export system protein LptA